MKIPAINFEELNFITILIRCLMAMILGGLIGFERGLNNQPAGMRTYILVSVTSAMVMMTNQFVAKFYPGVDPSRMGAQVVSGIGFLGAGMILITNRDKVKGLTTAAGLWSSACLGLAVGIGFYEVALVVAIILIITLVYLQKVKHRLKDRSPYEQFILQTQDIDSFNQAIAFINDSLITINKIRPCSTSKSGQAYLIELEFPLEVNAEKFISEFNQLKGSQLLFEDGPSK